MSDQTVSLTAVPKFVLRFSHNIIEHLGLKLYQNKPTNVIAELVSNSWDADSKNVWIGLQTKSDGSSESIVVADNGTGMDQNVLIQNYLVVGKAKRSKTNVAETSVDGRNLMGRKGIGKLAPFGVARVVNLLTFQNNKCTWLRFDYDQMVDSQDGPQTLSEYTPDTLSYDVDIESLQTQDNFPALLKPYVKIKALCEKPRCRRQRVDFTRFPRLFSDSNL